MLIINAEIVTMEAEGILHNAWLQVTGKKLAALGFMAEGTPKDDEIIDIQGASVYPGFIDAHTHLGMWENGLAFEGDDGNEDTDPSTPHLRAIDAVNFFDECFAEAARAGVTTIVTGPGSANPIGGQLAVYKTFGNPEEQLVEPYLALKLALGENPKSTYHGKGETPVTRMATAAIIREQLLKASRYLQDLEENEELPELDVKCEALIPVLKKEKPVHIHCHRRDDILTAIRIAEEFGLDYVLVHATEGYMIADYLKGKGAKILSGPLLCDRSKPELKNLSPSSVGVLFEAGVQSAIISDHPVIPIQYLPLSAGIAVREGLPHESALAAITSVPAAICGLSERIGSIKLGKDADFSVFSGDPLSISATPQMVFVSGKRVNAL
ncbi:MAG: amidohydrolase family protein [Oscillospiraceae bacterium]|nr:amidohydrolase family protein [Oscillospiraceae bacterium]